MLIATTNEHKIKEIAASLKPYDIHLETLGGKYPADPDLEETGDTFCENARIKALHYNKRFGIPTLADDSGLVIPALDGKPGVHSSRFMGEETSYADKMNALLEMLKEKPDSDRTAYFGCSFVLAIDGRQMCCIQKKTFGLISSKISGDKGFGYDPIFFSPELNKTFAEIDLSLKNKISHRGKAVTSFLHLVETHGPIRNKLLQAY